MITKKAISKIVTWKSSRSYFYSRMMRRICECELISKIQKSDKMLNYSEARAVLLNMFMNDLKNKNVDSVLEQDDAFEKRDIEVLAWMNDRKSEIDAKIKNIELNTQSPDKILESFLLIASSLDDSSKKRVLASLSKQ
jgi:hypothetical protein